MSMTACRQIEKYHYTFLCTTCSFAIKVKQNLAEPQFCGVISFMINCEQSENRQPVTECNEYLAVLDLKHI